MKNKDLTNLTAHHNIGIYCLIENLLVGKVNICTDISHLK